MQKTVRLMQLRTTTLPIAGIVAIQPNPTNEKMHPNQTKNGTRLRRMRQKIKIGQKASADNCAQKKAASASRTMSERRRINCKGDDAAWLSLSIAFPTAGRFWNGSPVTLHQSKEKTSRTHIPTLSRLSCSSASTRSLLKGPTPCMRNTWIDTRASRV
jgi:hypothetical protein